MELLNPSEQYFSTYRLSREGVMTSYLWRAFEIWKLWFFLIKTHAKGKWFEHNLNSGTGLFIAQYTSWHLLAHNENNGDQI